MMLMLCAGSSTSWAASPISSWTSQLNAKRELDAMTMDQLLATFVRSFSSSYRGVTWREYGKPWRAQVTFNGSSMILGYYDDEEEAARAYDRKAFALWGTYGPLPLCTLLFTHTLLYIAYNACSLGLVIYIIKTTCMCDHAHCTHHDPSLYLWQSSWKGLLPCYFPSLDSAVHIWFNLCSRASHHQRDFGWYQCPCMWQKDMCQGYNVFFTCRIMLAFRWSIWGIML